MAVVAVAPCQCFSPGGNQITSPGRDGLDGPTPALGQSTAGGDDQGLTQGVGVPCRPGVGLKRDAHAHRPRRCFGAEQWVDAHPAGEILLRPVAGRLGTASLDVHIRSVFSPA